MPMQKVESGAAAVTIWGSLLTWVMQALNWLTSQAATISMLILIGGFVIQVMASRRNKREHEARMKVLRAEAAAKGINLDL